MRLRVARSRAGSSRLACLIAAALALAACAGPAGLRTEATAAPFAHALSADYAYIAQSLKGHDADVAGSRETLREIFARKARAEGAAAEQPLPAIAGSDLARAQLDTAFAAGLPRVAPKRAARAQVAYDCWVLNARANRGNASASCKRAFDVAFGIAQLALRPQTAPAASPIAAPIATVEAQDGYTIYFGFDEWNLSGAALQTITDAVQAAHDSRAGRIEVSGHADTSGAANYNQALSERRAKVVREVMIQMGARPPAVETQGAGEKELAVPTRDGVREAENRRSVITLVPMESRVSAR